MIVALINLKDWLARLAAARAESERYASDGASSTTGGRMETTKTKEN